MKNQGHIPDLLNQNLHFNKTLIGVLCTLKCEKTWFRVNLLSLQVFLDNISLGENYRSPLGKLSHKITDSYSSNSELPERGLFSYLAYPSLSLNLTTHIILASVFLNSSFNPSCTLFFFPFSSSSPHNGVLELACEAPVANKRACVVHRWRMLTGDFSFWPSVQDVVLVA